MTKAARKRARSREPKAAADIRKAAQRYGRRAIEALWEIAAGAESDSARIAAIKEILDRGYGKEGRTAQSETEQAIIKRIERIIVDPKRWRYYEYLCIVAHKGGEHDCLRGDFDARLKLLADLASGSKDIQEVAASYRWVEPWYVNEIPKQYEGRAVDMDGAIYLKGCYGSETPHSGLIGYPKWALRRDWRPVPYTAKTVSIEMRFDQISKDAAGRICETYSAALTGTVMLDHGRPYIYVPELF